MLRKVEKAFSLKLLTNLLSLAGAVKGQLVRPLFEFLPLLPIEFVRCEGRGNSRRNLKIILIEIIIC